MMTSFITIHCDSHSGFDVIQSTFPKVSDTFIILEIVSKSIEHYADKETAKVAAKKMAELNQLEFVSNDTSLITVVYAQDNFFPVELTPSGSVIVQGIFSSSIQSAVKDAIEVANSRNVPLIAPRFL